MGVLALVIGGIFLASPPDCARGGPSPSVRADPYEDLPACRGADCRPPSQSIGGLTFGLTVEEAARAVPAVAAAPPAVVVHAPLAVGGLTLACQLELAVNRGGNRRRRPAAGAAARRPAGRPPR